MTKHYKIKDEDWELQKSEESEDFLLLKYERSHENYEWDQYKKEIYKKSGDRLELVCSYKTGVLGGSFSGSYRDNLGDFDDLNMYAGNHEKRFGLNTGTKGHVENIYLKENKIVIKNKVVILLFNLIIFDYRNCTNLTILK